MEVTRYPHGFGLELATADAQLKTTYGQLRFTYKYKTDISVILCMQRMDIADKIFN